MSNHLDQAELKTPKLTIGMATFDDYDGVYFTIQSIRLHHPEVRDQIAFLVVDNNPSGSAAENLIALDYWIPNYRYLPFTEVNGTAAPRDLIFREATTPYVMCMDSHILLAPGAIARLINYFDQHPDCKDLLQGPMFYDGLQDVADHFRPVWSEGMYGQWGVDERSADPEHAPFEIEMQGLGLFACRKDAWLGFNPRFLGFGGEEGYIHEKFRQAGHRALCLPFLRWLHRFARPKGVPYRNTWEDRLRNYLIGHHELGLDPAPVEAHFKELMAPETFEHQFLTVLKEISNPFFSIDAIYCINLDRKTDRWEQMKYRLKNLGIFDRVRRFSAIETPENHHVGCALSHRAIIAQAQKCGYETVMVIEDDAIFLEDTPVHLKRSLDELASQDWSLLHLGGHRWGNEFEKVEGCQYLEHPYPVLTTTAAMIYHHSIFQKILDDIPDNLNDMPAWVNHHIAIDQYFVHLKNKFLTVPAMVTQAELISQEDEAYQTQFKIQLLLEQNKLHK